MLTNQAGMMSETLAIQWMEAVARGDTRFITETTALQAVVTSSTFPQPRSIADVLAMMKALWAAFPDFKIEIEGIEPCGEEIRVAFRWGGTQQGRLVLPGVVSMSPTEKSVWVADVYRFRFEATKLAALRIESPNGGGIAGMLTQLGGRIP
jgi:hypothetical protein